MKEKHPSHRGVRTMLRVAAIVCATTCVIVCFFWLTDSGTDHLQRLQAVSNHLGAGRFAEAEQAAIESFGANDHLVADSARLMAAQAAAGLGKYERAVDHLAEASLSQSGDAAVSARLLRSQLLNGRLNRIGDAIESYRQVLKIDGRVLEAHKSLATLLAQCGLRDQAIPHALAVIAVEDSDLVILLARESAVIQDANRLRAAQVVSPDDPYPFFGIAAYQLVANDDATAEPLLRRVLEMFPDFGPAWGSLGHLLVRTGQFEALEEWSKRVPDSARIDAGTWLSKGVLADRNGNSLEAIRCFEKALRRRSDSIEAASRLVTALKDAGLHEQAQQIEHHLAAMHSLRQVQMRTLFADQRPDASALIELFDAYRAAGRFREAKFFGTIALDVEASNTRFRREFDALSKRIDESSFALVAADHLPDVNLSETTESSASEPANGKPGSNPDSPSSVRVVDDAQRAGLDFTYDISLRSELPLMMYQFLGGGVGVIDFDNDERPDFFLTQGGVRSESQASTVQLGAKSGDRVFRQRPHGKFVDVYLEAGIEEQGFGQGCSVGDLDGDGFSDVYVANIGRNQVWRNNGDGTFSSVDVSNAPDKSWTASVAIVDLNSDGLPDLYDVNYLRGDDLWTRTCKHDDGSALMCTPYDFESADDCVLINDGQGGFEDRSTAFLGKQQHGPGLGLVSWYSPDDDSQKVFVANDASANEFRSFHSDQRQSKETAIIDGLAFNENGSAEACMGIAVSDVNLDGKPDLHVTNFHGETNTIYLSDSTGPYRDRTLDKGLDKATAGLLGFGTQFFDSDLDGRDELFVANGHIQNTERLGVPYRMRPQLFDCRASRWKDLGELAGQFLKTAQLGRAVAVVDWNVDGAPDLVVTHLDTPVALLTSSSSNAGNYLRVKPIGTQSARDGSGAVISITYDNERRTRYITAGGGYMAENEHVATFGLGDVTHVERVDVRWPSGIFQSLENVGVDQTLIVIEAPRESESTERTQ